MNISAERIREYLDINDIEINAFECIDSTNSEAKRAVEKGLALDAIFVADRQTSGRGRRGKSFYSPNASGLYFTAVIQLKMNLEETVGITAAAAVAVADILAEKTKKSPKIKWVNDIFIDGRKVCGILTEAVTDLATGKVKAVIVGVGINLTTREFPEELADIAGAAGDIDRCELSALLYKRLKRFCKQLPCRSFMEDYRRYSLVLGEEITFSRNGADYTAIAENILDDGSLSVITSDGEKMVLNSGEISIKLK